MNEQLQELTKEIFLAMVTSNAGVLGRMDLTYSAALKAAEQYLELEKKSLS